MSAASSTTHLPFSAATATVRLLHLHGPAASSGAAGAGEVSSCWWWWWRRDPVLHTSIHLYYICTSKSLYICALWWNIINIIITTSMASSYHDLLFFLHLCLLNLAPAFHNSSSTLGNINQASLLLAYFSIWILINVCICIWCCSNN